MIKLSNKEQKDHHEASPESMRDAATDYLLITSMLFGTIGVVTFFPSLMSYMIFDSPGSENHIFTWVVFLCLFSFATICFLSIIISWICFYLKLYKSARLIALLPLVNVIVFLGTIIITEILRYLKTL